MDGRHGFCLVRRFYLGPHLFPSTPRFSSRGRRREFPLGPRPGWPRPVPEGRGGSCGRGNLVKAFRERPGTRVLVSSRASWGSLRRPPLAGPSPARVPAPRRAGRARARAGARLRAGTSLSVPGLRAPAVAAGEAPPSRPAHFSRSRPSGLPTLGWPWPAT